MRQSLLITLALLAILPGVGRAADVDFQRDVRPILAKHCFRCHGRDEDHREGGLRLDLREAAIKPADSGETAIVPGKADASELLRRVEADDDERMPPADAGDRLSPQEIATLRAWIASGARYANHWSFVPPLAANIPASELDHPWVRDKLDALVLQRMRAAGLAPSAQADRYELIRRLSFDLRGLPPSLEEIEAFLHDGRPFAYERLVDRFLADPAYGEHWARKWLDLARYADSRGFGSDPLRMNMWRYRDWVIDAFNRNLPYDQFTVEQLAGDLLPDATLEQRMATAFHRNTMTNVEGGTDDEEFRVAAVRDRVDTTLQVWMGLTMQCAKCHSHKYDPISQEEYYAFYDFFNQTADADRADEFPTMEAPRPVDLLAVQQHQQQIAALTRQIKALRDSLAGRKPDADSQRIQAQRVRIELPGKKRILSLAEVEVFQGETNVAPTGTARQSSTAYDGPAQLAIDGNTNGHYFEAMSTTHTAISDDPWWELTLAKRVAIDRIVIWNRSDGNVGSRIKGAVLKLMNEQGAVLWKTTLSSIPNPSLSISVRKMSAEEQRVVALEARLEKLKRAKPAIPSLPIMQELPAERRRETHIMIRGNFLQLGEKVEAHVPAAFHAWDSSWPQNRLGVAYWIIDRHNPLTARVAVNRIWAQLFGTGLVSTEEDFGTQGALPTHPELLDDLAVWFMDNGWDQKALLRKIVCSATYRQTARVTPERIERDPDNRWLARGPRVRLTAEQIRDQALAVSGLLSRKIGGPSVYPYQPPGLWRAAFNGQRKWPTSQGEDKYRRGIYTFWRRTVPYPAMAVWDAPSREVCTLRRSRTNTPLQALVTLNDPVFVEASQAFARRILQLPGTDRQRIETAFLVVRNRPASPGSVEALEALLRQARSEFAAHADDAVAFATEPLGALPPGLSATEAAAWTVVANTLLNLDGAMSK